MAGRYGTDGNYIQKTVSRRFQKQNAILCRGFGVALSCQMRPGLQRYATAAAARLLVNSLYKDLSRPCKSGTDYRAKDAK